MLFRSDDLHRVTLTNSEKNALLLDWRVAVIVLGGLLALAIAGLLWLWLHHPHATHAAYRDYKHVTPGHGSYAHTRAAMRAHNSVQYDALVKQHGGVDGLHRALARVAGHTPPTGPAPPV